jgi:hypothetical protein
VEEQERRGRKRRGRKGNEDEEDKEEFTSARQEYAGNYSVQRHIFYSAISARVSTTIKLKEAITCERKHHQL